MPWATELGGSAELEALLSGAVGIDHPLALAAGLLLACALLAAALWRGPARVRVAATAHRRVALPADASWWFSAALRALALAGVALALAGPVALIPQNPAGGSGIDLVIALDASGSMNALDGLIDGRRVTRLDLAKRVIADFIRDRDGDRIGLVVFGQRAFTQCPLTVDHRLVLSSLRRIDVGIAGDATAIGEAIGLATRRFGTRDAPAGDAPPGERVLLLLTDGRHNSGQLGPETAAQVAAMHGVRIHAIGIGGTGVVPFARRTPGEPLRFESVDLDRDTLQTVASRTGGRFFHARKPRDLAQVAQAIDRLEARPRLEEPQLQRASLTPWALGVVLLLLAVEVLCAWGLLRRLP
jgi:Ca-activated chloride channel family protein